MQIVNYIIAILLLTLIILLLIPPLHKENFEMLGDDWSEGAKITTIQAKNLKVTGNASLGKIMADNATLGNLEVNSVGSTLQKIIANIIYPVDSTMIRYDNVNPNTLPGLSGTTWTKLDAGKFIKTASSAGSTGGSLITSSSTVSIPASNTGNTTITINQMPKHTHIVSDGSHTHQVSRYSGKVGWTGTSPGKYFTNDYNSEWANSGAQFTPGNDDGKHTHSLGDSGGGGSHSHSIPASSTNHTHTIDPSYVNMIVWQRTK